MTQCHNKDASRRYSALSGLGLSPPEFRVTDSGKLIHMSLPSSIHLFCSSYTNRVRSISHGVSRIGAVHKVRHSIYGQFLLPSPMSQFVTHPGTPKYVTHLGSPIFSRPCTKNADKTPLYTFSLNYSRGFCPGGFVRGSFVWKVLSGVIFVRSPFCQNTSVTTKS